MQAGNLQPEQRQILQRWASRLQQWRVHQLAAAILEAGGPLNVVGAQLVYLSQPLLGGFVGREQFDTLAGVLEAPEKAKTFIRYLREEAP